MTLDFAPFFSNKNTWKVCGTFFFFPHRTHSLTDFEIKFTLTVYSPEN